MLDVIDAEPLTETDALLRVLTAWVAEGELDTDVDVEPVGP